MHLTPHPLNTYRHVINKCDYVWKDKVSADKGWDQTCLCVFYSSRQFIYVPWMLPCVCFFESVECNRCYYVVCTENDTFSSFFKYILIYDDNKYMNHSMNVILFIVKINYKYICDCFTFFLI